MVSAQSCTGQVTGMSSDGSAQSCTGQVTGMSSDICRVPLQSKFLEDLIVGTQCYIQAEGIGTEYLERKIKH
jgi:hypothetical protein